MKKGCTKCHIEKELDEFYKEERGKFGVRSICKSCDSIRRKKQGSKEKGEIKRIEFCKTHNSMICGDCNTEKSIKEFSVKNNSKNGFLKRCKKCERIYANNARKRQKPKLKIYLKNWRQTRKGNEKTEGIKICKECDKEKNIKEFSKQPSNKDGRNNLCKKCEKKYSINYVKNRRTTDQLYKLTLNTRSAVNTTLKRGGYKKNSKTVKIIGCSFEELKTHLEKKFEPWMTWKNHGKYKSKTFYFGWDIDHIIPLSSANTEEELLKLFHYTNLQPLCSYTNRFIKGDRLDFYD